MIKHSTVLLLCLTSLTIVAACAPSARQASSEPNPSAPQAPKRLRMGILQEPKSWGPFAGTSSAGGAQQPTGLTTRTLTVLDPDDRVLPVLAESVPTIENGDWRINPDGSMD